VPFFFFSFLLYLDLFRLEERVKGIVKARPTGELARMKLPANDLIWLECIRLERRAVSKGASSGKLVESLVARALQECPHSGEIRRKCIS